MPLASGEAAEEARAGVESPRAAARGEGAGVRDHAQGHGARGRALRAFFEGVPFHVALVVAGALFLLVGAFHGNVWFDESYSVGIAGHSFADIWQIGAGDVHPVLYYWGLHAVSLVFGQSILAYRLFTLAGAVLLGVLGLTHVRRDFGARAGVLFSFVALFTPYIANMSVQVRMYSWAVLCVTLCALYAWRAFSCLRKRADGVAAGSVRERAARMRCWAGVPRRWWLAFFAASLASAYLHYFGAIAAFVVNVLLFAYLVARHRSCGRALGVFVLGAAAQVALYAPWLLALESQLSVVSNTYWANFTFPTTLIELATYPVLTSGVSFALKGAYGAVFQGAATAAVSLFAAVGLCVLALLVARSVRKAVRRGRAGAPAQAAQADETNAVPLSTHGRLAAWARQDGVLACALALVAYVAVFLLADVASRVADSFLLYYRYLFVAIGLLFLGASLLLARAARSRVGAVVVGLLCVALLAVSVVNQALVVGDAYSEANTAPVESFDEAVAWAGEEPFGYHGADSATNAQQNLQTAPDAAMPLAYARNADFAPTVSAPLVLSSDIGIQGVMAVQRPSVAQTYMDWQPGNWALSYRAYAPALTSVKTWEVALDGYEGRFVVLGQSQDGSVPRDVTDLQRKPGVTCVKAETFYRPYERTYFTIALMEKQ